MWMSFYPYTGDLTVLLTAYSIQGGYATHEQAIWARQMMRVCVCGVCIRI